VEIFSDDIVAGFVHFQSLPHHAARFHADEVLLERDRPETTVEEEKALVSVTKQKDFVETAINRDAQHCALLENLKRSVDRLTGSRVEIARRRCSLAE